MKRLMVTLVLGMGSLAALAGGPRQEPIQPIEYPTDLDEAKVELGKKLYGANGYDVASISANRTGDALSRVLVIEDRPKRIYYDPRLKEIMEAAVRHLHAFAARTS